MIEIENVKKSFGQLDVLKGMSLTIPKGQATGIVGPNGAGKTTLIKTILGLVKADSGLIKVNGQPLDKDGKYRKNIGYMPQVARYPENMRVYELFDFIKGLRDQDPVYEEELIDQFTLRPELEKSLRNLSGGNRQKVGATLAMMFNPDILFFDEPTAGLDPRSSHKFKKRVENEKEDGKTVIITSHIMSELEQLVDHVVFILDGNIRYYGSMEKLLNESNETRLEAAIATMMDEDPQEVAA
ncbi:ABC transporter ATP-binding protein [Rhodohalobacter barkolensis]|uniref:Copper ABC transporter ATP-binding protein n=1 Tax=Rhodohalobacter barkolensis TaxID=2053187 RepID=A0A2N0VF00_9BACT|nr:ABC transporter ATP-binding protein [Rhodohalobacter barkolensis]PKD42718.1 copper ABC transporter ATP-binding protein [Rhodohalobacter barkolensis]